VLTHVGAPEGDERIGFRGTLDFAAGRPATLAPNSTGVQLLIENVGDVDTALFELTNRTHPVPTTGCDTKYDGWKKGTYKDHSGALPPTCAPGSADGLVGLHFADRRARGKGIPFTLRTKNSRYPTPSGAIRATIVLGAEVEAGLAGECATITFPASRCRHHATTIRCR
jgi:hypothetical protein